MKHLFTLVLSFALTASLVGCSTTEPSAEQLEIVKEAEVMPTPEEIDETPIQDDWGVTLTATNVTPTGLTLVCQQSGGETQGRLQTGTDFFLEVYEDGGWTPVEYLPMEYPLSWTAEALIIPFEDSVSWDLNWSIFYGELPSGQYRISKSVMDFIETGNYTKETYYAIFEIE